MARPSKRLSAYRNKRDFEFSPEPAGGPHPRGRSRGTGGAFVVQQHHASHPHYDFRLEMDGVLKSWAVPKGPSMDPGDKRLAVEVEDHPLEYGAFEGTIPKGQYGGGSVLLWDKGSWRPGEGIADPRAAYRAGKLKVVLDGTKLRGGWSLVRMKTKAGGGRSNWLLMKDSDRHARSGYDVTRALPQSVTSKRVIEDIEAGQGPRYSRKTSSGPPVGSAKRSRRDGVAKRPPGKPPARRSRDSARSRSGAAAPDPASLSRARRAALPIAFAPQLATPAEHVPSGPGWLYEVKFDGYRLLARIEAGSARLLTRHGKDWTNRFPGVLAAVEALGIREGILDGEVVAFNAAGISEFGQLQAKLREGAAGGLSYQVFDIPYCSGYDLTQCPLAERRSLLERLLPDQRDRALRLSRTIEGDGDMVARHACRLGLEGIVAKRAQSVYTSARVPDWVKVRCSNRQEMVIGGFTEPRGSRVGFGALLLGYYDPRGELVYAGKVGTGFDRARLVGLAQTLKRLERDVPAFVLPPRGVEGRGAHWIEPKLVAEVEFTEWTPDGRLRHPIFIGLREDKPASEVVREAKSTRATRAQRTARGVPSAHVPRRTARPKSPRATGTEPAASESSVIEGVAITHPDRVVCPESSVTKLGLARYYAMVAPWIMSHAKDRPLSLFRCPSGAGGQCFFQKHPDFGTVEGLDVVKVTESKGSTTYAAATGPAGLVYLVQMNTLELHGWGSRADKIERPDRMVFDLDPGAGVAWPQVVDAARLVRERLLHFDLVSFVKTTGGKGLHVVVPIQRGPDWARVKEWARARADEFAAAAPNLFVATMSKALRRGKVFIDYLRNQRGGTSVLPYSSRARPRATVSMPVEWDALDTLTPEDFRVDTAAAHLSARPRDPWKALRSVRQGLGRHDAVRARRLVPRKPAGRPRRDR